MGKREAAGRERSVEGAVRVSREEGGTIKEELQLGPASSFAITIACPQARLFFSAGQVIDGKRGKKFNRL
jgi:hypothetical protein